MKRNFRKPLVLMTPKSHLRSKVAASDLSELVNGRFHEVLDEVSSDISVTNAERIVPPLVKLFTTCVATAINTTLPTRQLSALNNSIHSQPTS